MRADADLRARQADTVLATELLRIAQSQLQAGTGVGLDVTRAQAQLASTRASLIASRNARDHAHLDLLRSLALPLGTDIALTDSLSPAATSETIPDEATLVAQALKNRPDLVAEEERIRAAKQGLSAIKAERLPSLGLVADDGVIGKNGARLLNTYTWGLQVTLPIFDGFKREARMQEQESVVKEAEIRRRDLEQQAQVDVRGALLDLANAREQLGAATERLRLAEQEVTQARDRFNAGVAGNADVVNASLALTASRTFVNDAETAYQLARVSLARAIGSVTTLR
jgi:outer membrane protein TolC